MRSILATLARVLGLAVPVGSWIRDEPSSWSRRLTVSAVALVTGAVTWGIGLGLAAWIDFHGEYLRSWPGYLALYGLIWSVYWYLWAVRHVPGMVDRSTIAFQSVGDARGEFASRWRRRFESFPIVIVLLAYVSLVTYVVVASQRGHAVRGLPTLSGEWTSEPDLWVKNVIFAVWALPIVSAIVGSAVGTFKYLVMLDELAAGGDRRPLRKSLPIAREGFRRAARFGVVGGLAWTGAIVVIVAALATRGFEWVSVGVVASVSAIGVLLLFWPEWVLHRGLERLQEQLVDEALANEAGEEAASLEIEKARTHSTWAHRYAGALALTAQVVIPVGTFVVGLLVES